MTHHSEVVAASCSFAQGTKVVAIYPWCGKYPRARHMYDLLRHTLRPNRSSSIDVEWEKCAKGASQRPG